MKKVALIFSGYSTQFVGMGKDLYDTYRLVQEFYEEAYNCQNTNFVKLCFASSDNELAQVNNAYQSLFLYSASTYTLLKNMGLSVDGVAGIDVGYYSAIFASGAISFPDGLYYLSKLARFYESYIKDQALESIEIVGLSLEELTKVIKKFSRKKSPIYISILKDTKTHVISGEREVLETIKNYLQEKHADVTTKVFSINFGLYSESSKPVYDQLKLYLEKIDIKESLIDIISPSGNKLKNSMDIRSDLIGHILYNFNYLNIFKILYEYDIIIAISPKGQLEQLLKKYYPNKEIISFASKNDISKIKALVGEKFKEPEHVS